MRVIKRTSVGILPETKLKLDTIYYKLKIKKQYKSVDQFLNEIIDKFADEEK
jgi:hypothetical protein